MDYKMADLPANGVVMDVGHRPFGQLLRLFARLFASRFPRFIGEFLGKPQSDGNVVIASVPSETGVR
jgi:hypothetical protein